MKMVLSTSNVTSILNFPVPINTKEVHRFVSLASYIRKFLQNFAHIAGPLNNLIQKNV